MEILYMIIGILVIVAVQSVIKFWLSHPKRKRCLAELWQVTDNATVENGGYAGAAQRFAEIRGRYDRATYDWAHSAWELDRRP